MTNEQKIKWLADLQKDIDATKQQIDAANADNDYIEAERLNDELNQLERMYFENA